MVYSVHVRKAAKQPAVKQTTDEEALPTKTKEMADRVARRIAHLCAGSGPFGVEEYY